MLLPHSTHFHPPFSYICYYFSQFCSSSIYIFNVQYKTSLPKHKEEIQVIICCMIFCFYAFPPITLLLYLLATQPFCLNFMRTGRAAIKYLLSPYWSEPRSGFVGSWETSCLLAVSGFENSTFHPVPLSSSLFSCPFILVASPLMSPDPPVSSSCCLNLHVCV